MKVFAFSGSLQPKGSMCEYTINKLVELLSESVDENMELFFKSGNELNIEFNTGTGEEFLIGQQYIKDDVAFLEKKLLDSDIIILASPVYMHGVSAYMKNFMDRITYWTHLLKLTGKLAVTISCCDTNGVNTGTEYMTMFLHQLGCAVLSNIEVKSGLQTLPAIDSIISHEARKVTRKIKSGDFDIPEYQREKFRVYKDMYLNASDNNPEKKYWEENNLFKYDSFDQLFTYCYKKTNLI